MNPDLDAERVWRITDEERERLCDLLDGLTDAQWGTASLCTGWTVRDVAAHLTLAETGATEVVVGMLRAGGSFDRMIRDAAKRRAARPVDELRSRLRAMVGSRRTAAFTSVLEPLIDVLVHTQDIARPLGLTRPTPTEGAVIAADHVWDHAFPFRARRRLRGYQLVATDADWQAGSGARVEGPIAALLLLLTGRPAALPELSGPGVAALFDGFGAQGNGSNPESGGRRA